MRLAIALTGIWYFESEHINKMSIAIVFNESDIEHDVQEERSNDQQQIEPFLHIAQIIMIHVE